MMAASAAPSRDMARMDGKHFSLDSVLTVLSFLIFWSLWSSSRW